jgi:flagellin
MSSILTNNGAMVALKTLQSVNKNLGDVQGQISTGLKVGSAKDNAAVFSISQVMKSDVAGFKAISDSLSLGASTVSVASNAASSLNDTLEEIKSKVISANEDNVDKTKLQDEITSLVAQLESTVGAAQFNGLNLLNGDQSSVDILSSLDRQSDGTSTTGKINIDLTDTNLTTTAGAAVAGVFDSTQDGVSGDASAFSAVLVANDDAGTPTTNDEVDVAFDSAVAPSAGNVYNLSVGDTDFSYTAKTGDDNNAVAFALRDLVQNSGLDVTASVTAQAAPGTTDVVLNIKNDDDAAGITVASNVESAGTGKLAAVAAIDVTNDAEGAINVINQAIDDVIDAQATFGTAEKRIDIQSDFMGTLIDSFTSGIGSLVDANLEQASARLQALQVQQQLGTQALSIANQAPQSLLSLFR